MEEKRRFTRHTINRMDMRVYTHLKGGCYSVNIKDIGKGGAFLETPFIPKIKEVITYEILDSKLKLLYIGNGVVSRIKTTGPKDYYGFSITFSENLPDSILKMVTEN